MRIVIALDSSAVGAGPAGADADRLGAALRTLDREHQLVLVYETPPDGPNDPAMLGVWLAGLLGAGRERRPAAVVICRAVAGNPDTDGHHPVEEVPAVADLLDGGSIAVCSAAVLVAGADGREHVLTPTGATLGAHDTAATLAVALGAERLVLLADATRAVDPAVVGRATATALRHVEASGGSAAFGDVGQVLEVVAGAAGTEVSSACHAAADRDAALAAAWGR